VPEPGPATAQIVEHFKCGLRIQDWPQSTAKGDLPMSAYCNQCGNALPQAARFCSVCGTAVNGAPFAGAYGAGPVYGQAYGQGYGWGPSGAPVWGSGYQAYPPRLTRPIFGRQFAGVCSGLARTYGWDVGTVRVLTVLGAIFLCPIVEVAYFACWIGIPEEQPGEFSAGQAPANPTTPPPQA
jgi:phage shock protein C